VRLRLVAALSKLSEEAYLQEVEGEQAGELVLDQQQPVELSSSEIERVLMKNKQNREVVEYLERDSSTIQKLEKVNNQPGQDWSMD